MRFRGRVSVFWDLVGRLARLPGVVSMRQQSGERDDASRGQVAAEARHLIPLIPLMHSIGDV